MTLTFPDTLVLASGEQVQARTDVRRVGHHTVVCTTIAEDGRLLRDETTRGNFWREYTPERGIRHYWYQMRIPWIIWAMFS